MMKPLSSVLLVVGLSLVGLRAVDAKEKEKAAPAAAAKGKSALQGSLSNDPKGGKPTTSFTGADAHIYLLWKDAELKKGEVVRAVVTLEDGGPTINKNVKIFENSQISKGNNFNGSFNVDKPATGWTPGKYRADLYVNADKAASYKFTIK